MSRQGGFERKPVLAVCDARNLPMPSSEHAPDDRHAVLSVRTAENGTFALGKLPRYMPVSRTATGRDECEQHDR